MAKVKASDGKKVSKTLLLTPTLRAELREAAQRERRTETSIIEEALEVYFQRQTASGLPDELGRAVEEYLARQGYHPATG